MPKTASFTADRKQVMIHITASHCKQLKEEFHFASTIGSWLRNVHGKKPIRQRTREIRSEHVEKFFLRSEIKTPIPKPKKRLLLRKLSGRER